MSTQKNECAVLWTNVSAHPILKAMGFILAWLKFSFRELFIHHATQNLPQNSSTNSELRRMFEKIQVEMLIVQLLPRSKHHRSYLSWRCSAAPSCKTRRWSAHRIPYVVSCRMEWVNLGELVVKCSPAWANIQFSDYPNISNVAIDSRVVNNRVINLKSLKYTSCK